MSFIIVLLIIITILQVILCKFSLWWIIALISRLLFCSRLIGATIKIKKLAIAEGIAFAAMLLFNWMFKGENGMPWIKLVAFLLFSLISVGLEYLDDILYVYVVEDLKEDD